MHMGGLLFFHQIVCVCVCMCVCVCLCKNVFVESTGNIQLNVRAAINGSMSLFCLGFGNDVDYSFLDVMSRQNQGIGRRIYEGSDAVVQLQVLTSAVSHYSEMVSLLFSGTVSEMG